MKRIYRYGAWDSVKTLVENPVASVSTLAGGLLGIDDPHHSFYDMQRNVSTTRTVYGQTLGDLAPSAKILDQNVLTAGYNILMSLGDMAVARGIGGGLAGAAGGKANFARNAMQFVMSSESAASTILNDLERGWDSETAMLHGLTNGLIEAWTERGFMDSLFNGSGTFMQRVLNSGMAEGMEELESGVLQIVSDSLFAHMSENESEVEEVYKAFAATMSEKEAAAMTFRYFGNQLAMDGIAGFATGSMMQAGNSVAEGISDRAVGKDFQQNGDLEAVLGIAEALGPTSESAPIAKEITEKQAAGKKVSTRDMGKMLRAVTIDIGKQRSRVVEQVVDTSIENRLMELGETQEAAKALAPVVRKTFMGEKLTVYERANTRWSDNASQVVKEMSTSTPEKPNVVPHAANEEGQRTGQKWQTEMQHNIQTSVQKYDTLGRELSAATNKDKAVSKAEKKAEELVKGKEKMEGNTFAYTNDDGSKGEGEFQRIIKSGDNYSVVLKNNDSGSTSEVNLKSLDNTGNKALMAAIDYVTNESRHEVSEAEANVFVQSYLHQDMSLNTFAKDFESSYLSGYSGINQPPSDSAPEVMKVAYEQGKREAEADEAKRVANTQNARKVGNPVFSWIGEVNSDKDVKGNGSPEALTEAMKGMTESQRGMVEFGNELGRTAGLNVVYFASKADSKGNITVQNGSYDPNTHTIYLGINAGANTIESRNELAKQGRLGDAVGRVLGHEVTHVLEATSGDAYAKYKQAVKEALTAKNLDWATLVREKINNALAAGEKLTYAGAEAEVVADASEYMLQDSKFVQNLDTTIKGKIKAAIRDFIEKVNEAFRRLGLSGHVESRVLRTMQDGVAHYEKRLQDLWDMAFSEMVSKGAAEANDGVVDAAYETGEVYSYTTQNSLRVRDEETIARLENQQHITTYRAMQVIDGKLYPPMAEFIGSKKSGNREDPGVIGQWEMAAEHPELIKWVDGKPKFELKKTNDDGSVSTVPAAYNPYMHSSNTVLNDQFSKAFQRNNLVVVECVVPVSESDGAYHAQYAKDATGWHEWKSGIVAGELAKQKSGFRRDVFLSRYIKPVRVLSDAEVAEKIAGYLDGTNVTIPFQSVWPSLRDALVQAGVEITEPRGLGPSQAKIAMEAFEEWQNTETTSQQEALPVQYSTRYVGKQPVVWVENNILDERQEGESVAAYIQRYIKNHIGEMYTIIESGSKVYIGDELPGEYTYSKYTEKLAKHRKDLYSAKMRATPGIGEMIEIATNRRWEPAKHTHNKDAKYGVYKYDSKIAFPVKDKVYAYSVELVILNSSDGKKYLYDVQNIKKDTALASLLYSKERGKSENAPPRSGDAFDNNVPHPGAPVNGKIQQSLRDQQYMDAVNSGDMATAQRMVDEAAKAAGYDIVGYHGTKSPTLSYSTNDHAEETDYQNKRLPFTVFKPNPASGIYIASNRDVADGFKRGFGGSVGTTYKLYVKFENPFIVNEHVWTSVPYYDSIPTPTAMKKAGYAANTVATEEIAQYARSVGYDGVVIEGIREGYDTQTDDYIAFFPEQIKSADPVTYDDNGNVIPLSERFNSANEDIRYSLRDGNLLSAQEYARVQSAWVDYTVRGYKFFKRNNDGIIIDLDSVIVYTDDEGTPEYVLEVGTDDRWSNNDVYNMVIEMEKEGVSHEMQHRILKSCFGEAGARFRTRGKRAGTGRQNRAGAGRNAGGMGQGDHGQVPGQEEVSQHSLRDTIPDTLSIREYLGVMQPTGRMTETEKLLLKRYQENLRTLAEKEKQVAEQETIMQTATGDELTKARNRRNIYRTQANRAARALSDAERNEGFARLMATSLEAVNRYTIGSTDSVADATDALEKEIADLATQLTKLEGDISRTAAGQKAAFARGLFDQKQLNTVAQGLKDAYGSRMSAKAIADRLALAYSEIYADSGAEGAKRFAAAAHDLAEDILRGNKYRYKSEILPLLAEQMGTISLSETDLQEIKNAGLTLREYRGMLSPYVKVTANSNDLSSYASNAAYYGEGALTSILGDDTEGNLAMKVYDIISTEKAKEADNGYEGKSEGQLITDIMSDIAGNVLPLTDNSTTAATLRKELLKYAGESEEAAKTIDAALAKAKSTTKSAAGVWHAAVKDMNTTRAAVEYYRKLEEQRRLAELQEQKQVLTDQLKGEAGKMLEEAKKRYQQQMQDIRDRRDLNIEIGKRQRHIKRVVKRLDDRIRHEEDYKNVKEPMKPAVHALVRTFIDGFGNLVFDSKTADRLRTVYDAIANEDAAPEFYSDDVANMLTELAQLAQQDANRRAEGSSSMSAVQEKLETYTKVAEIADHIYKMVTAADEVFVNGKRESFAAISAEVGNALNEIEDKPLLVGAARDAKRVADDLLRTGNMTPTYFFQHLNNSGLNKLFDGMMTGQTEYAQAIRQGRDAVHEAKKRYNFHSWQHMKQGVEFRTEQGHTIALTTPQMMWVYATAKREATNKLMDTHHLDQGGFRYEAKDLPRQKGKMTAIPGSDRLHKLSAADVKKITDTLTAEQKACADELVSYLSNECAEQGNRASMELFGIRKYKESYYFPFKTASDQRYQHSAAGSTSTTNDARVKHTSFTHSLRKGANTPLVMGDFFEVIADHINQMATYSSFVVPIESMNRVLNAKVNEEADGSGNDVTIRSLVGRKHGEPAQKYMADLMKDLNGGPQTDNRGTVSALFRAFKRGAVMGSLSVSLQQPTAIARAFAYVNPKHFAHITMEGNKQTWERMMKYSGTAVIKDMGKFDVGTGKMANDWIANSDLQDFKVRQRGKFLLDTQGFNAFKNNWVEFATSLPGVMDRITWTHIWKAIEAEQAEAHPGMDRSSEEFQRIVGQRFDFVINRTQVYDSILSKSQNMRSKNALAQMSTAFMAEPTLNINMLYDAATGKHTPGQRAGIVTSVAASSILAAAMASLIAAWNKDDDDRKWQEKYLAEFASRAVDSVNPLTMIPYVADVWNMVNGYDIERTDLSVMKDVIDYTTTFVSKAADPDKANTWRDYENLFGTIANLTGIPGKNISRDIRRVRNFLGTDKSASSGAALKYTLLETITPLGLYEDSNKAYCQRLVAAVADGDAQEAYDLWDYLTNSKKPSQNTINTNVRNELKRRVQEGSLTTTQATEILRKYAPYVNDKDNLNKPKEWAE